MDFEPTRLASYDEENLLAEIKRVAARYFEGKCPRRHQFNEYSRVTANTVIKHFGSWSKAMTKAGFAYERSPIDRADLIKDLRKIKDLNQGKYFTGDFYKSNGGKYSVKTLKKRLGYSDWKSLLENVLSLTKQARVVRIIKAAPKKLTEKELFDELKRVWDKFGRRPSYSEFKVNGKIGINIYERDFGTWTKAIQVFCLKHGYCIQGMKGSTATKEILLSELKAIAKKNQSNILKFKTYKGCGGTYTIATFQNHFGSWQNALESAGLRNGRFFTNEDLFSELQRLWEMLGRQPITREMRQYGKISRQVFQKRFGSSTKAIHAFCKDRANDVEENVEEEITSENTQESIEETEANTEPINKDAKKDNAIDTIIMITPRIPSLRLRFRVFNRDNFACVKCGRSPAKSIGVELQVDHIKPYSRGGETVLENLQTLCKECNLGKSNISYQ